MEAGIKLIKAIFLIVGVLFLVYAVVFKFNLVLKDKGIYRGWGQLLAGANRGQHFAYKLNDNYFITLSENNLPESKQFKVLKLSKIANGVVPFCWVCGTFMADEKEHILYPKRNGNLIFDDKNSWLDENSMYSVFDLKRIEFKGLRKYTELDLLGMKLDFNTDDYSITQVELEKLERISLMKWNIDDSCLSIFFAFLFIYGLLAILYTVLFMLKRFIPKY